MTGEFGPARKTPLRICEGQGKPCYDKVTAQTAANLRYRESHIKLRVYQCDYGDHWHLTKKVFYKSNAHTPIHSNRAGHPGSWQYGRHARSRWRSGRMRRMR